MSKYFISIFHKYFKPQNLFEENLIILNLLKYFSAIPLQIEREVFRLEVKYLVYPILLMIFNICTLFYILQTYLLVKVTIYTHYVEHAVLFIVIHYSVFSLGNLLISQFLQRKLIIKLLKKLDAFDNFCRVLDKSFDRKMKYYQTPIFINLGFLTFASSWSFYLHYAFTHFNYIVLLIDSLYLMQNISMMLIIYTYISLVYSVSRRFSYVTKDLEFRNELLNINHNEEELEIKSKALFKLCEILNILNNSFGIPVCISIVQIFLWMILDYFSIIKLFVNNSTYGLFSIAFASGNQMVIFIMLWTCDYCTRQVRYISNINCFINGC